MTRNLTVTTDLSFVVAIAYVMHKAPYVFPIIGGRKIEHLHANIEALDIALTDEQIKELESAVPFDLGFPTSFFVSPMRPSLLTFVLTYSRGMERHSILQ